MNIDAISTRCSEQDMAEQIYTQDDINDEKVAIKMWSPSTFSSLKSGLGLSAFVTADLSLCVMSILPMEVFGWGGEERVWGEGSKLGGQGVTIKMEWWDWYKLSYSSFVHHSLCLLRTSWYFSAKCLCFELSGCLRISSMTSCPPSIILCSHWAIRAFCWKERGGDWKNFNFNISSYIAYGATQTGSHNAQ